MPPIRRVVVDYNPSRSPLQLKDYAVRIESSVSISTTGYDLTALDTSVTKFKESGSFFVQLDNILDQTNDIVPIGVIQGHDVDARFTFCNLTAGSLNTTATDLFANVFSFPKTNKAIQIV